jgi:L-histidine Nalpha-methyltransferase
VPLDVDSTVLRQASAAVAADHPGLDVLAVVGDFEHHLTLLPQGSRRLVQGASCVAKERESLSGWP